MSKCNTIEVPLTAKERKYIKENSYSSENYNGKYTVSYDKTALLDKYTGQRYLYRITNYSWTTPSYQWVSSPEKKARKIVKRRCNKNEINNRKTISIISGKNVEENYG